ncbi:hypothetical protein M0805_006151 [Coniferiporia weirii]|nr:hypothetical protein M0805_006151 [Coniferiporia weirii]
MESSGKIELPGAFEHADTDHLVVLIADMLDRLMEHNDKIPLSPEALTRFHSRTPPSINALDYLRRIVKYANVERTCLLITLHYIDQICARLPHFTLSSLTCHRFIIAAVVVASKALCDAFCTNSHYAKVGGIRVGELNVLEKELLSVMDWRLTSTREVLDAYYVNLIRTHSSGAYVLAGPPPTSVTTSPKPPSVESDMDSNHSASPTQPGDVSMSDGEVDRISPKLKVSAKCAQTTGDIVPGTVLIDRATLSPRPSSGPTFEQNMAFVALCAPTLQPAAPASATGCTNSPTYSISRVSPRRSTESSPVSTTGSQCVGEGSADRLLKSPFLKKRVVEYDESGAVKGGVLQGDSPRPRTRPRIDSEGGGTGWVNSMG